MTAEAWKSLFDIAAVVLLFLTFAAGAGVLITGNIINKRQEAKLRTFDGDLTKAKLDLNAQVGRVASLQKDAANAHAAQQQVELALEKQRERTAQAETQLLDVQKRQTTRHIENHSVSDALKGKPSGLMTIWYQPNDPEAYLFAFQIMGELSTAGWRVALPTAIPEDVSSVAFLGPEYQQYSKAVASFDRHLPPAVRVGGTTELGLMSNSPADPNKPNSLVDLLTAALKPLARNTWSWKLASSLPDGEFVLIVGPKP